MTVKIASTRERPITDDALESILRSAYVEEGFTPPDVAANLFAAAAVRARGELLCAWVEGGRRSAFTVASPGGFECGVFSSVVRY